MVRWIAPVLSFTAEEIWQHMPQQAVPSVFLATWYSKLESINPAARAQWRQIMAIRELVNLELERARNEGVIGSGLAAEVDLYCSPSVQETLSKVAQELRFILITSEANVYPLTDYEQRQPDEGEVALAANALELKVVVRPSAHPKCQRCWHRREDVGSNPAHPDICERCIENIAGVGEQRLFA
jgi:isoleucyl-tRNA synthetase